MTPTAEHVKIRKVMQPNNINKPNMFATRSPYPNNTAKTKLRPHKETNLCARNQHIPLPPVYVPYNLPIERRFVRPHDKSLTESFLDKLMSSLQML